MKFLNEIWYRYFSVDVRSLALFRFFIGIVAFFDIYRRYEMIDVFYSTKGIRIHSTTLTEYSSRYFSLLDSFPQSIEAHVFFILAMFSSLCLMVGYKTKFFQVLTTIGVISIHNHLIILENAGDIFFNAILVWTLFLPLGRVWSFDSLHNSLKHTKEINSNDINGFTYSNKPQRIYHLAYFAILLQFSAIYFFNFINKTGSMWKDGTAVYYLYQLETFLTPFGHIIQPLMIGGVISVLTYMTIAIEFSAPFLIFSPIWNKWTRRIALFFLMSFHFVIGISTDVGGFSWVMMSSLLLLLSKEDMDAIAYFFSKWTKCQYIVFYDKDCGFCHFTARLLNRFDIFNHITWADKDYKGKIPKNLLIQLESTIVVWDEGSNQTWTKHRGFSKILYAIPLGCIPGFILLLPGVSSIAEYIYDTVALNRTRFSQFFGFSACGISTTSSFVAVKEEVNSASYSHRIYAMISQCLTNSIVAVLLVGCGYNSLQANEGIDRRWGKDDNKAKVFPYNRTLNSINKFSKYARMNQKWNMFAPTVLKTEKWVVAEATLNDGSNKLLFSDLDSIPKNFSQDFFPDYRNQFWRKFFTRLNKKNNRRYISDFKTWIMRTNYFDDILDGKKIRQFKLWQLSETSHNPGKEKRKIYKVELKKKSTFNTKKKRNSKKGVK